MSIYDYKVKEQDGTEISMDRYKGQVLLIVNMATGCGFTPQYTELQEIYEEFRNKGLKFLIFRVISLETRHREVRKRLFHFVMQDLELHSRSLKR